jgi:hypothetical protein
MKKLQMNQMESLRGGDGCVGWGIATALLFTFTNALGMFALIGGAWCVIETYFPVRESGHGDGPRASNTL